MANLDDLDYRERQVAALEKAEGASDILDKFVHGAATDTIAVRSGTIHPLSHYEKQIKDVTGDVDSLVISIADLLDTLP